jgi:hypothetical protein
MLPPKNDTEIQIYLRHNKNLKFVLLCQEQEEYLARISNPK